MICKQRLSFFQAICRELRVKGYHRAERDYVAYDKGAHGTCGARAHYDIRMMDCSCICNGRGRKHGANSSDDLYIAISE